MEINLPATEYCSLLSSFCIEKQGVDPGKSAQMYQDCLARSEFIMFSPDKYAFSQKAGNVNIRVPPGKKIDAKTMAQEEISFCDDYLPPPPGLKSWHFDMETGKLVLMALAAMLVFAVVKVPVFAP